MVALTVNTPRTFVGPQQNERRDVNGGSTCFVGSILQLDATGQAIPYVTGLLNFLGISKDLVRNTTAEGVGADGDLKVNVSVKGIFRWSGVVGTIAETSRGDTVYATTDNDLTLTSSPNMPIGTIYRVITVGTAGVNVVEIYYEADGLRSIAQ